MIEIEPTLRECAIRVFGNESLVMKWLAKPVRRLGGNRPIDVDVRFALEFLARLEHGFAA